MLELTAITIKTHPELYQPGIIFTNAPYRKFFYRVEKISSREKHWYWHANYNCPLINVLSKGGITIEFVSGV
jgi:hypothetical protein